MKRVAVTREEKKKKDEATKKEKFSTVIRVMTMRGRIPEQDAEHTMVINTTSRSKGIWKQFSPFRLGPLQVPLADGTTYTARNFENAWQYSKVYAGHIGDPEAYLTWAKQGWDNAKAVRYPMGKGMKPEHAVWGEKTLGYIEARKTIYAPHYAALVVKTGAFRTLKAIVESGKYKTIWLRDFDGYDHTFLGMSLDRVLNEPKRKMGHAFVLLGCLTNNHFWEPPLPSQ